VLESEEVNEFTQETPVELSVLLAVAAGSLELAWSYGEVDRRSRTDPLTGLYNRAHFGEQLEEKLDSADRHNQPVSLVMVDIDHFKQVNDTYGHQAGDAVLRQVGQVLLGGVRQVDLAGRYGGEEFALILPETDLPGALRLAARLRAMLETTPVELPDGKTLTVTASFGVALRDELLSADELVAVADEALYAAKRAGKNRVMPEPAGRSGPGQPERRKPKKAAAPKPAKGEI